MAQQKTDEIPFVDIPFAAYDPDKVRSIDFLKTGVSSDMVVPEANGGIRLTREMLNGLGYYATLGGFLDRVGYPYGKDREFDSAAFNGYPKGSILISEDDDFVREYVSTEDNNTNPLPEESSDGTYEGDEHWKPTFPPTADFFPSIGGDAQIAGTFSWSSSIGNSEKGICTREAIPSQDGWYSLRLRVDSYYSITDEVGGSILSNPVYQLKSRVLVRGLEIAQLDSRFASESVPYSLDGVQSGWSTSTAAIVPLKGHVPVEFNVTKPENSIEGRISLDMSLIGGV